MNSLLALAFTVAVTAVAAPRPQLFDAKKALRQLPHSIKAVFIRKPSPAPLSLFDALLLKNRNRLRQLLVDGANPNNTDYIGRTPLHLAVAMGDLNSAQLLLAYGADPNYGTAEIWAAPPLFIAARGDFGFNPLHRKRFGKYTQMLRLLLRYNANPNLSRGGHTALHICAGCGFTAGMEVLLEAGAEIEALNAAGLTPLLVFAQSGSWLSSARLLIKHKANLNAVDAAGNSALHHAAIFSNTLDYQGRKRKIKGLPRLAKLLIKNNADLYIINNAGESARDIAIKQEHWRVVGILAKYGVP